MVGRDRGGDLELLLKRRALWPAQRNYVSRPFRRIISNSHREMRLAIKSSSSGVKSVNGLENSTIPGCHGLRDARISCALPSMRCAKSLLRGFVSRITAHPLSPLHNRCLRSTNGSASQNHFLREPWRGGDPAPPDSEPISPRDRFRIDDEEVNLRQQQRSPRRIRR